jgi:hypothetical protein
MSEKVGVEHWRMHSDPGYRSSSGAADVHLVPEDDAASASGSNKALYDLAKRHERVDPEEFLDAEPVEWRRGVCNYKGVRGVLEVPEGLVAVQITYSNISTQDGPKYWAEVLNEGSLVALYKERARKYLRLAQEISEEEDV